MVLFSLGVGAGCAIEGPVVDAEPGGPDDPPEAVVGDPVGASGTPESPEDPGEDEPGPGEVQGGTTPPDDGPEGFGGGQPNDAPHACYPGSDESGTTCLPLVDGDGLGAAYAYPSSSQLAYQAPIRFVDLEAVSPSTMLAPNFALGELMQEHKGRYALFQPHVVEKLQAMRSQTGGALLIHSAYRSPGYNAGVDGATFSRHMYGDGIDMHSAVVSLNAMSNLCSAFGADYVSVYTSHVHCDWRYAGNDPAFFGTSAMRVVGAGAMPSRDAAWLEVDGDGRWLAVAESFDEGEPYVEWTSYDAHGRVLGTVASARFRPALGASSVEVVIGGRIGLRAAVDEPERATRQPSGAVRMRLETLSSEPSFRAGLETGHADSLRLVHDAPE